MLFILFAAFCLIGLLLTTVAVAFVWLSLRRDSPNASLDENAIRLSAGDTPDRSRPLVSILKPLCGLEDDLALNLASFAGLAGVDYEVILSIAEPDDPALVTAKRLQEAFPNGPFRIVVGGVMPGLVANPKVERLIAASRIARGSILFISDANVRVRAADIARTIAPLIDDEIGLVVNPFVGEGAISTGSIVESLNLLTFVLPGTALATAMGKVCVVGKSMAIRRDVCDAIGGFELFAAVLAEDQAIGLAVRRAGYRVVVSPVIVRNVTARRTFAAAMHRQIRWCKIRFAFSKLVYLCELLGFPFPFALLALSAASITGGEAAALTAALCATALGIRICQAVILARLTGTRLPASYWLLVPVQELLQFAAYFAPYLSNEVTWRGHRARLGRGTVMMPSRSHPHDIRPSSNDRSDWDAMRTQ